MGPEIFIALAAVFVSGGAIGTAGTLLTQWLLRRFDGAPTPSLEDSREVSALRTEVADMSRQLRNLDARLDFTERLLDGALTPTHLPLTGAEPAGHVDGEPRSGA